MKETKKYIYSQVAEHNLSIDEAKRILLEIEGSEKASKSSDVAIIGMAGRFPSAKNVREFWQNLINRKSLIRDFPESRIADIEDFINEFRKPGESIRQILTKGGFFDEIDKFDAGLFRISKKEAEHMDPIQRIMLEVAYETIEDSGYTREKLDGSNTSVYIGRDHAMGNVYSRLLNRMEMLTLTGSYPGILASRISYTFNLKGASLVTDTACSSGLVSVYQACRALQNNECDMALAGGVSLYYVPLRESSYEMVESKDSVVRTFDNSAQGTTWGEGICSIMLKRHEDAIRDGDQIYGVIKAIGINNDGVSSGITAPNSESQTELLETIWDNAGINPESIEYIEAHGTATELGDPIEIYGISQAMERYSSKKQFCGIGAVKSNIGHLVAASGVTSLIKVLCAMKNETLPPTINFDEPNQHIDFIDSPLYVVSKAEKWSISSKPRRAAVNSFGFSGTNCHVVIDSPVSDNSNHNSEDVNKKDIFVISARSKNALEKSIKENISFFKNISLEEMANACYTSTIGRSHYNFRLAIIGKSPLEFTQKLQTVLSIGLDSEILENEIYFSEHRILNKNAAQHSNIHISEQDKHSLSEMALKNIDKINENIENGISSSDLEMVELAKLYVKGAVIKWDQLYLKRDVKKISIPTYQFDHSRYWPAKKKALKSKASGPKFNHNLIGTLEYQSIYEDIYVSNFNPKKDWVLGEHKIEDRCAIPGVTYLEIAYAIGKEYFSTNLIEIENLTFFSPLMINDEADSIDVQIVVTKERGKCKFSVTSTNDDLSASNKWTIYAEGIVSAQSEEMDHSLTFEDAINNCKKESVQIEKNESEEICNSVFKLSNRWDNVRKVNIGEDAALVEIELPNKYESDLSEFTLHPSMLDNAMNYMAFATNEETYLPFSYKSFKVSGRFTNKIYSYAEKEKKSNPNSGIIKYNVYIFNDNKEIIAISKGYSIKKVTERIVKEGSNKISYFSSKWKVDNIVNEKINTESKIAVLFYRNIKDYSLILDECIKFFGRVIKIEIGNKFHEYEKDHFCINENSSDLKKIGEKLRGISISNIIFQAVAFDNHDNIKEIKEYDFESYFVFQLVQMLHANKVSFDKFSLIVNDAHKITENARKIDPSKYALCALTNVLEREWPKTTFQSIDIEKDTSSKNIFNEILSLGLNSEIAFRENVRYSKYIDNLQLENIAKKTIEIKSSGVYVVTGGAGAIGSEIIKFLLENNTVNIAIISRSGINGNKENAEYLKDVIKSSKKGSKIEEYLVDVTKNDEMENLFSELQKKYGIVNGIFHCAGLPGDGLLINDNIKSFKKIIETKVLGYKNIIDNCKVENLDFLINFSSIASVMAFAGQGSYVYANAYLDATAENDDTFKTVSINWPSWREKGMAVRSAVDIDNGIIRGISNNDAISSLLEIMGLKVGSILVGELNIPMLSQIGGNDSVVKLSSDLLDLTKAIEKKEIMNDDIVTLVGYDDESKYTKTQRQLGKIWANALGVSELNIFDSYYELGGDSIQAIEIVTIAKEIGFNMDTSDIFEHPSIFELAEMIEQNLNIEEDNNENNIKLIKKEQKEKYAIKIGMDVEEIEDIYPLTNMQISTLNYNVMHSSTSTSVEAFTCKLNNKWNYDCLIAAIKKVYEKHSILHSTFKWKRLSEPILVVNKKTELYITELDWSDVIEDIKIKELTKGVLNSELEIGFDPTSSPLFRVNAALLNDKSIQLVITYLNSLFDGWSISIIMKDIMEAYRLQGEGKSELLNYRKNKYENYVSWYENQPQSNAQKFWAEELSGFVDKNKLNIPESTEIDLQEKTTVISTELEKDVLKFSRKHKLLPSTIYMGMWALYNCKEYGIDDVLFSTISSGRSPDVDGIDSIVGLFTNNLPIRIIVNQNQSLLKWLSAIQDKMRKTMQYTFVSIQEIANWAEIPVETIQTALQHRSFVYMNFPMGVNENEVVGDLRIKEFEKIGQFTLPRRTYIYPDEKLLLKTHYNKAIYREEEIIIMQNELLDLLQFMINSDKVEVESLIQG